MYVIYHRKIIINKSPILPQSRTCFHPVQHESVFHPESWSPESLSGRSCKVANNHYWKLEWKFEKYVACKRIWPNMWPWPWTSQDILKVWLLKDKQTLNKIVAVSRGMHVSPVKHSYAWLPRKCNYRTDRQKDRLIDGRTDRCRTKWSIFAAMLRRQHKNDSYVLICFSCKTRDICTTLMQHDYWHWGHLKDTMSLSLLIQK